MKQMLKRFVDEAQALWGLWKMSSAVADYTPKELTTFDRIRIRFEVMYRLVQTVRLRKRIVRQDFQLVAHAKALEAKGVTFGSDRETSDCTECPFQSECPPVISMEEAFKQHPTKYKN